eukprot:8554911-Pyramimonas_sp.AAC.2
MRILCICKSEPLITTRAARRTTVAVTMVCSICGRAGHNRSTCESDPDPANRRRRNRYVWCRPGEVPIVGDDGHFSHFASGPARVTCECGGNVYTPARHLATLHFASEPARVTHPGGSRRANAEVCKVYTLARHLATLHFASEPAQVTCECGGIQGIHTRVTPGYPTLRERASSGDVRMPRYTRYTHPRDTWPPYTSRAGQLG